MISDWELILRLITAAALGSVIGAERERVVWAAGLRTHMLVCMGSCLFMIVSAFGFNDTVNVPHVSIDPSRVAAQVVSGIGFLGAGSILLRGEIIRGLTTAASLWTVAAIGLAVGGGLYVAAIASVIIVLVILAGLKPLEDLLPRFDASQEIKLRAPHDRLSLDELNKLLGYRARRLVRYVTRPSEEDAAWDNISITFTRMSSNDLEGVMADLEKLGFAQDVHKVTG